MYALRNLTPRSVVALAVCAVTQVAHAWDFGMHPLPLTYNGRGCMSYDGSVVGGFRQLYTQAGVTEVVRPQLPLLSIWSLNDDGSVFGGSYQSSGVGLLAVIDRGPGDYTSAGSYSQQNHAEVIALSGDGAVGLVNHYSPTGSISYLLLANSQHPGSSRPPGYFNWYGTGLSRNGQVAVGTYQDAQAYQHAYRYRVGIGYDTLTTPSGQTLGDPTSVSADGSVIIGRAGDTGVWRWSETSYTELALDPLRYSSCYASDMNDDATIIVGSLGLVGSPTPSGAGGIWFEGVGWVLARDYFLSLGIGVPAGRTIQQISQVSSDGRTFLGRFDDGQTFVVKVPSPSSLAAIASTALFASRRRRR